MNDRPDTLCKPAETRMPLKACFEVAEVLASAVLVIAILFTFVLRFAGVVGASMEPTLYDGEWLAITTFGNPQHGQIVIISPRNEVNEPLVKRVIAVAGDRVDLRDGHVWVNGNNIFEPYIPPFANTEPAADGLTFPLLVPENAVFVLGDNRQHSTDSRHSQIGLVRVDDILGRVLLRVWPNPTGNFDG